jgi:redox-regulated HSP33 family molecular chaperone
MQIRCQFCHRPYALGKQAVHDALDYIFEENLHHYDTVCPHCGKTNHVSRDELHRSAPDWNKNEVKPEAQ